MIQEIVIPDIGEKVESGIVVAIPVAVGDKLAIDQTVIELETDKAVVEIPSTIAGTIAEISVKVDDEVKIGQVIMKVKTSGAAKADDASTDEEREEEPEPQQPELDKQSAQPAVEAPKPAPPHAVAPVEETSGPAAPAAPSVRRLARELGADVNQVEGTGPGGRITRDDVKRHVKKIMRELAPASGMAPMQPLPDFEQWGEIQREAFSAVRRITAENVGHAWNVVPHVTQFDEADITALEEFRQKYGEQIKAAGGKLTATTILLKVITAALERFPRFNASIDMKSGEIIYKKYYHIGIATDTDRGLLVPVIRDVDKKSISELAIELTQLAERARHKKVSPDEMAGGTFTISNQGGIGGINFTPIVFWPQVAILGVSRSSVQPRYVNDAFVPRTILPLSLSYDHRIVDGADAARFLRWVVEALEHPLLLNLES